MRLCGGCGVTDETKQQRQRRLARERKRRSRKRLAAMDMKPVIAEWSKAQREAVNEMAEARGFDGLTEYLYWLAMADRDLMRINPGLNPAAECVTRHVREFCSTCDTPELEES